MRPLETGLCVRDLLWLRSTRRWSAERIQQYQQVALRKILDHALRTVPHYRALGVRWSDLAGGDLLRRFPLLTKTDVQHNADALLSDEYRRARLYVSRSSGSTGQPTSTWYDRDAWVLTKHALKLRRVLQTLGRPPYRLLILGEDPPPGTRLSRRLFVFGAVRRVSIHDPVSMHLDTVMRLEPTGIYGSPSWLLELVRTAKRQSIALPPAHAVWTSSEVLTDRGRAEIARAFGCAVSDVYGCSEFKEVAVECAYGRRHVNFESSFVEVLPAQPGQAAPATSAHAASAASHAGRSSTSAGPIVITSLVNRAMPLIRYRIGDVGRLATGECACGSNAPWLDDIRGREVDLIRLADGRTISPYVLSTIIESDPAVARYQLLEATPGGIEVRYELRGAELQLDTVRLGAELARAVGGALRFSFVEASDIYKTAAGKYRPLIRGALP